MESSETSPASAQGLVIAGEGVHRCTGSLGSVLQQWQEQGGHLWLDLTAPEQPVLDQLMERFQIDTQAMLDILDPHHKAHVEEHADYFFLQLPLPAGSAGDEDPRRPVFATEELNIFGGRGFILTLHTQPQACLQELLERYAQNPAVALRGHWPESLLHGICDAVMSAFYPHLEYLEDQHDHLERLVFVGRRSQIQRIVQLKRRLHSIRRVIAPLRDAMSALTMRDLILMDPAYSYLFDQLHARSMRLMEFVENLAALFDGLLQADLAMQSNRMNQVMKTLTVVTTIMMPLTVLTGFFGMNFEFIPGLHSPSAFWGSTAFMLLLALLLVWLVRRRGWW